jgi:hypothetical protein
MAIVKINNCGQGVNKDLTPEELPAGMWTDTRNMRVKNGYAEKFGGISDIFQRVPPFVPYHLTAFSTPGTKMWIYSGTSESWVDDGSGQYQIFPIGGFSGDIDDRWTSATISNHLVMNNGVDVPHSWDGDIANKLVPLVGWDSNWTAASVRPFKQYLIAMDVTKSGTRYPSMVKWSAPAEPNSLPPSWDETDVTQDAGERELSETGDIVVDGLQLGDSFVIYKERSTYVMTYIGQPFIFRFQQVPIQSGIMAKGCVTNTPLGHVVLTDNDVILFNGQSSRSIADGRVLDYIFNNINKISSKRSFVTASLATNEVFICFPEQSSEKCSLAAVWNWAQDTWAFRDLPDVTYGDCGQLDTEAIFFSWEDDTGTWEDETKTWDDLEFGPNESRLLFTRDSAVSALDVGSSDNGALITTTLERTGMSFDDPYSMKLIRAVYPRIDGTPGTYLDVYVGASQYPDQTPTYTSGGTYVIGQQLKVDTFSPVGRYLSVKFTGQTESVWRLRSFDLDVVQTGAH